LNLFLKSSLEVNLSSANIDKISFSSSASSIKLACCFVLAFFAIYSLRLSRTALACLYSASSIVKFKLDLACEADLACETDFLAC